MVSEEESIEIQVARSWGKAIGRHRRAQIRESIGQQDINPADFVLFVRKAIQKDDRSLALLLYSYFDRFLLTRFRELIGGRTEELLGPERPLHHSYPRLVLAHGLRWIGDEVFNGLNLMRRIRNEFAHNVDVDGLCDDPIAGFQSSMPSVEDMIYKDDQRLEKTQTKLRLRSELSVRELYVLRSCFFIGQGMIDTISRPEFLQAGFPPEALHFDDPRTLPPNVKFLMAGTTCLMLLMCATEDYRKYLERRSSNLMELLSEWGERFDRRVARET